MKLLPDTVTVPLLSTPENPTNDRLDGVVEAPPSIDTFNGARVQLITSLVISMFVPAVKGVGAAMLKVVLALDVEVVNPLSCSTATSG